MFCITITVRLSVCEILRLSLLLGVDKIYGVRNGYRGFWQRDHDWELLTPERVSNIHYMGGVAVVLWHSRTYYSTKQALF